MDGNVIINMFRMHWNASKDFYDPKDHFDNYDFFAIRYVFGRSRCDTEYCTRKRIVTMAEEIFNKFSLLHTRSIKLKPSSFDIEFNSTLNEMEIFVCNKDSFIKVSIQPLKNIPG